MQPSTPIVTLGLALLEPLDPAEGAVDLVLGVLADRAGVVEDRVGLVDVVGQLVPLVAELADDQLAVEQVHLAADGLDVELLLRAAFGSGHGPAGSRSAERLGRRSASIRSGSRPDCTQRRRRRGNRNNRAPPWEPRRTAFRPRRQGRIRSPRSDAIAAEELGGRHRPSCPATWTVRSRTAPCPGGDDEPVARRPRSPRPGAPPRRLDGLGLVDDQPERLGARAARPVPGTWRRPARAAWRGRGRGRPGRASTSRSGRPPCGASGPW